MQHLDIVCTVHTNDFFIIFFLYKKNLFMKEKLNKKEQHSVLCCVFFCTCLPG